MKTKRFHLGDVLSVITGRLVSLRHIDGMYDILNFMTGDNLFTHQLPRASDECKPYLLKQFPELTKACEPRNQARLDELLSGARYRNESTEEACMMWLKWLTEPDTCNFKQEYDVQQIPQESHQRKNPIEEAADIMGGSKKVIVIKSR